MVKKISEIVEENTALKAEVIILLRDIAGLRHAHLFVCQTLASALNYPKYVDDQKNFPNATEADGVHFEDYVAESLSAEAAQAIRALQADRKRLEWLSTLNIRGCCVVPNGVRERIYVIADDKQPNKLREQIDHARSRENGQVEVILEIMAKAYWRTRTGCLWEAQSQQVKDKEIRAMRAALAAGRGR